MILRKFYISRNQILRHFSGRSRKLAIFWQSLSPNTLLVDIGASYFYNKNWYLATKLSSSTFIQIDPNAENLSYLDKQSINAKVHKVASAISGNGGERTLYITNVDSGSTLFEPSISPDLLPRLDSEIYSYFFPFEEKTISTQTLDSVIPLELRRIPMVLKLDAQGSELEILRGSESIIRRQVAAIEVEASLLRHPFAKGGTKFAELQLFLESIGYELVNLDLLYSHGPITPKDIEKRGFLSECDALFVLNHREIQHKSTEFKLSTFFVLSMYGQLRDCLKLLEGDETLKAMIYEAAGGPIELKKLLSFQERIRF